MSTPLARDSRDDRGAIGAVTALMLAASLALSAVVVDVGNAWQERRHVVTSTDAAALAAAQDYVHGTNGCNSTAGSYVTANNPDASMTNCVRTPGAGTHPDRVTVEAEATVDFLFAQVFGVTSTDVTSSTTVSWEALEIAEGGLRPFGLCLEILANLDPPMTPGNNERYTIYYGKDDQPDACNGGDDVPGNWGVLDFDGGSNPQGDIKDWTEYGYGGPVAIGDWIEGNPGAFSNSLSSELQHLVDNVDSFTLPVFSESNDLGGANAEFLIDNFLVVRLHDFKTTGNQANRFLEIEFLREVVPGSGGDDDPAELGAYVIGICAVDGVNEVATCN